MKKYERKSQELFVGAIDLGTTGVRFMLFDESASPVASFYREIQLTFPQPGWVEQDPSELLRKTIEVAQEAMESTGTTGSSLVAIGIANQQETAILWDARTGKPVHSAIVWQDRRTAERCAELQREEWIPERTGLVVDPYFSATKLEWMFDHDPSLRGLAESGHVLFGTPDAWLIWNLTGIHATDSTNASRTLLFDLRKQTWDEELYRLFSVPPQCLPQVRPSVSVFGRLKPETLGTDIPLAGVLGDQQAALFGQIGFDAGSAKMTWGTGGFLLQNTGGRPIMSQHRLISTIAYSTVQSRVNYALEGSTFAAGAVVQWLRDGLGILSKVSESEKLAREVSSTDGVYFVPALTGLGTPHWDPSARGTIVGITRGTTRAHIVRAALEAIAYQTHDLVKAMEKDTGSKLSELRVDGGVATNDFLCQFQSDILGIPVVRPAVLDTTAIGAAFAAGLAVGFWNDFSVLRDLWQEQRRFIPHMDEDTRKRALFGWSRAVERAKGLAE